MYNFTFKEIYSAKINTQRETVDLETWDFSFVFFSRTNSLLCD